MQSNKGGNGEEDEDDESGGGISGYADKEEGEDGVIVKAAEMEEEHHEEEEEHANGEESASPHCPLLRHNPEKSKAAAEDIKAEKLAFKDITDLKDLMDGGRRRKRL